jgi:hypothetical protein
MEHSDSNNTADEIAMGIDADHESPLSSSHYVASNKTANTRPSAIERQIAAVSALRYSKPTQQNYAIDGRPPNRFGLASVFAFFLIVAIGAALAFTDVGPVLQEFARAVMQRSTQTTALSNPAPASRSPTAVPKKIPEPTVPATISVPIADVSLRNTPALLEQLVRIYRSQLGEDPNDAAALSALNQLRQRSLSELEAVMTSDDDATSIRSLELVSRLFPELADNAHYKYLALRINHSPRATKTEPTAEPEPEPKPKQATSLTPAAPATSPAKNISPAPAAAVSPPSVAAAEIAKQHVANALPTKPTVRVVSITPGAMVEKNFVPHDEGNVFLVEISYRNFENADDESEVALIARLGLPGDPMVLAEAPVNLLGHKGATRFLMETVMPGNAGQHYRLNFMWNGELLASRTLRLSTPR